MEHSGPILSFGGLSRVGVFVGPNRRNSDYVIELQCGCQLGNDIFVGSTRTIGEACAIMKRAKGVLKLCQWKQVRSLGSAWYVFLCCKHGSVARLPGKLLVDSAGCANLSRGTDGRQQHQADVPQKYIRKNLLQLPTTSKWACFFQVGAPFSVGFKEKPVGKRDN